MSCLLYVSTVSSQDVFSALIFYFRACDVSSRCFFCAEKRCRLVEIFSCYETTPSPYFSAAGNKNKEKTFHLEDTDDGSSRL